MPRRTQGFAGRVRGHQPAARSSTPTLRRLCRSTSCLPWTLGVLPIPSGHQEATSSSARIAVTQSTQRSDLTKQLNQPIRVAADKLGDPANVAGKGVSLRILDSTQGDLIPTIRATLEPLQHLVTGETMNRGVLPQGPTDKA